MPTQLMHSARTLMMVLLVGSTAFAQDYDKLNLGKQFGLGGPSEATVSVSYSPKVVKAGDTVTVNIEIDLPVDSYVYSQTKDFGDKTFGGNTRIQLTSTEGLSAIEKAFRPDRQPKVKFSPDFKHNLETFSDGVTFSKKFKVDAGVTQAKIAGKMNYQVCDKSTCLMKEFDIALNIPIDGAAPTIEDIGAPGEIEDIGAPEMIVEEIKPVDLPDPIETDLPTAPKLSTRQEIQPTRKLRGNEENYPVKFAVSLYPENAQPGDTLTLSIAAEVQGDYHIFALDQDPEMSGLPTEFQDLKFIGLEPVGEFTPDSEPHTEKPLEDIVQRVHYGTVTWSRELKVTDAGKDGYAVRSTIRFQLCNENGCIPPAKAQFAVGNGDLTDTSVSLGAENQDQGLIAFVIICFVGGFAALLTPCVYPMIPITVSFFLKQSEKGTHKPITMASVYCLSIIAGFTVFGVLLAALFGPTSLNDIANYGWLNLALALIFILFAFNLLGMFEIRVPAFMLNWSSQQESRGGLVGVIFMALTYTLISFTCTFGVVGPLLGMAAKGTYLYPILGMAAFSTAFASPFFFLALFPSYLQSLPKSGGWMNRVKVVLGLLELGIAFKFLSVMDLAWSPEPFFFDYSLVMASWMVILLVCGLYLLGSFKLPHDTPMESVSVVQFAFALTFLGFGTYIGMGVFGTQKPTGIVWEQIEAFAPPVFNASEQEGLGPVLEHDGLEYALDFDRALKYAKQTDLPLFLDFTGVNCVNCRKMENSVLSRAENHKLLEKFVRVQLYVDTDTIPGISSREESIRIRERNLELQSEWFGDVSLPAYAVVSADGQDVVKSLSGYQPGHGVFTNFLQAGMDQWKDRQIATGTKTTMSR